MCHVSFNKPQAPNNQNPLNCAAQHTQIKISHYTKIKFSIEDLFIKCGKIRTFLWIWSHLVNKSLMEKFIFCAVIATL